MLIIFVAIGANFLIKHPNLTAVNWHPFIPANTGSFGQFGWSGILRAAGIIFFAYIGFDAVSTAAQEAKNPAKDMPIGILARSRYLHDPLYRGGSRADRPGQLSQS